MDIRVKIAPNTLDDEVNIDFEDLLCDPQLQKDISLYPQLQKLLKENPAKRKLWVEFNDYIRSRTSDYWKQFKNVPSIEIIRERAVKALCKYPDNYLDAFEIFGKPKSDLILRHGVDYEDDFYDLIEAFKENGFSLEEDEIYVIFGYTTNFFYKDLNSWLRSGKNLDKTKALKELINLALSKLPEYKGEKHVKRGIKTKTQEEFDKIVKRYPEHTDVLHKEFISLGTSTESSYVGKKDVKIAMNIELKNITEAKDISDLADGIRYRGMERAELLFPTDVVFYVKHSFYNEKTEMYFISLKEK